MKVSLQRSEFKFVHILAYISKARAARIPVVASCIDPFNTELFSMFVYFVLYFNFLFYYMLCFIFHIYILILYYIYI